jgi:hypothetical protein
MIATVTGTLIYESFKDNKEMSKTYESLYYGVLGMSNQKNDFHSRIYSVLRYSGDLVFGIGQLTNKGIIKSFEEIDNEMYAVFNKGVKYNINELTNTPRKTLTEDDLIKNMDKINSIKEWEISIGNDPCFYTTFKGFKIAFYINGANPYFQADGNTLSGEILETLSNKFRNAKVILADK